MDGGEGSGRKRVVYLAGPMTGLPQFGAPIFNAAADDLRARGYRVVNPVDLDLEIGFDPMTGSPEDFDLTSAVKRDIDALTGCDVIVMLPGHEASKGATAERHVAMWLGLPVLAYPSMVPLDEVDTALQPESDAVQDDGGFLPVGQELVGRLERFTNQLRDGEMVVNERGGKQSHISARFDCIPPEVLRLLSQCLGFGCEKYGKENWRSIDQEDHLAHAMNHINEFRMNDRSEPHLVNAMARITFALAQAVESGDQPTRYIHPDMVPEKLS